jgi:phospholipid/cholesterol/gamma-HCH transport system ATP-binding protein
MNHPASNPNQRGISVGVHGLRKSFNGQEVLRGLDFEVHPGEIFVIMGPSGSGKSVLLKHIIGLEPPDAGEILIDGQSIQSPEVVENYRLAMVFQSGALLNSRPSKSPTSSRPNSRSSASRARRTGSPPNSPAA